MVSKIPIIKKRMHAFLVGEEGKISKQALLTVGVLLGSAAVSTILSSDDVAAHSHHSSHSNALNMAYSGSTHIASGTHTSHSDHTNGGWC